jgi:hypothetical protein
MGTSCYTPSPPPQPPKERYLVPTQLTKTWSRGTYYYCKNFVQLFRSVCVCVCVCTVREKRERDIHTLPCVSRANVGGAAVPLFNQWGWGCRGEMQKKKVLIGLWTSTERNAQKTRAMTEFYYYNCYNLVLCVCVCVCVCVCFFKQENLV